MEKSALKEYLEIVIDMEKDLLLQKNTIDLMRSKIADLKIVDVISTPVKRTYKAPASDIEGYISMFFFLLVGGVIFWWGLEDGGWVRIILGAAVVVLMVCGIISDNKSEKEKLEKIEQDYKDALIKYENDVRKNERLVAEKKVQSSVYEHELSVLQERRRESFNNLEKIYSMGIVYQKYRHLPMLCSIYEYIVSGRAESLEGKDGAYNILELEMRLDRLITQMDTVISRLDSIRENQYTLYAAVSECNHKMSTLIEETQKLSHETLALTQTVDKNSAMLSARMEELNSNSAISAYNNQRTATELHYLNRMNYLAGKNNGTFFNLPPV